MVLHGGPVLPISAQRLSRRGQLSRRGPFLQGSLPSHTPRSIRVSLGVPVDRSTGSVDMPNWSVPVIVRTFPRTVRVIEHTLIPLKDGTLLAARIWLPDDAEQNPVPAILEYLPYRKRDGTYQRDALTHPYLAGHGYAGVRVDIRGSGESGGLLFDEYATQEQNDGVEVI